MEQDTPPRLRWMDLISGILRDARSLLQQEMQLLRDEVRLEVSTAGRAASKFLVGVALGTVGALFLLLMLVHGLHDWTVLPLWACYGLVGGLLFGIGITLVIRAQAVAGSVRAMPHRTLFTMKENIQWIRERMLLKRT